MEPLFIERDGHRTWLKWHRAKRRGSDPVFTAARIREGMRIGASVEVDLVVHAGHGCAVLHDFTLERETTGTGLVRETPPEVLRGFYLRDNTGAPLPDRVLLLEDLCGLLTGEPPHPEALLQLDLKEERGAISPAVVAQFGRSLAPVAGNMIISGGDLVAVRLMAGAVPGLRIGFDPCYGEHLARLRATGDFDGFVAAALDDAPDADMIYLDYRIVLAAADAGVDLVAPVHAAGRRVDAWTINRVTPETLAQVARLLDLRVDQITTDDPEGMIEALGG